MSQGPETDLPNVLIVSIDSLRADFCSYIDESEDTTPNLDRLASEGTGFKYAISPSTWTLPVHASTFTGLYPREHGVVERGKQLGDHPTLAETLTSIGYTTRSFSRNVWLDRGDTLRGFDHKHYDIDYRGIRWEVDQVRSSDDLGDLAANLRRLGWTLVEKLRRQVRGFRSEDRIIVNDVVELLQTETDPFCYFVHLNDVHNPYRATEEFKHRFGDHTASELDQAYRKQSQFIDDRLEFYLDNVSPDDDLVKVIHDLYRGCIAQADSLLGRLLDALERTGVAEETVVVVFGDHGDHLGGDGHYGHHLSVEDAVVRVPLVVRVPGAGLDRDGKSAPVQLNDLYPTILELVGVDPPKTNSVSLANGVRSTAFVHYFATQGFLDRVAADGRSSTNQLRTEQYAAWRSPGHRLSWFPSEDGFEIRDGEFSGSAADDADLREALFNHFDRLYSVSSRDDETLDESARNQLKAMGYL